MRPKSGSGKYPDRDPDFFYDLARERLATRFESLNLLDNKLSLVLSASSTLLGILIAVFALRPDSFHGWALGLLIASGSAWLVLTGLALYALWHRPIKSGPDLQKTFNRLATDESDAAVKWKAAVTFWCDYDSNKRHQDRKANALTCVLALFVIQTALLVGSLALVAAGSSGSSHRSRSLGQGALDAEALAARVASSRPGPVYLPDLHRSSAQDLTP
jgi:hypothetical protein